MPTAVSPAPFPHTTYYLQNQIVFPEFLMWSSFPLLDKTWVCLGTWNHFTHMDWIIFYSVSLF